MQRFYRVLLLISIATGGAIGLRPSAAEELATLAMRSPPSHSQQTPYASPTPYPSYPTTPAPYASLGYAQPWTSAPPYPAQQVGAVGEAEVSDTSYAPNYSSGPVSPSYSPAISGPSSTYPLYTPQSPPNYSPQPPRPDMSHDLQRHGGTTGGTQPPHYNSPSLAERISIPPHQPPLAGQPDAARPATDPPAHQTSTEQAPEVSEAVLCEGAQILARVGPKVVLASEVIAPINEILGQQKDKIPPSQLEVYRKAYMKKLLEQRIDIKLVYYDAERKIPKENVDKIKERLGEQFELAEVPRRIKEAKLGSRQELEEKMLVLGTSLEREKRAFTERVVAMQWIQQQATANEEISHEEMLAYYQDHLADFEHAARARWEQLMVRKSGRQSDAEARTMLGRMGNEVLGGAAFAEVAKKQSQGPTASKGGVWDWTNKGSLVSDSLDQAVFGLPVGQLSQIIEDAQGFHIVRVIERKDASRTPFVEAQVEIRKKIRERREKEAREKYLTKLREEIPVWTVFDSEVAQKPEPPAPYAPFMQR